MEAEGEDQTHVQHQADISITAPDSEASPHCKTTTFINRSERLPAWALVLNPSIENIVYSEGSILNDLHEYQGLLLISKKDPWALAHLPIVGPAEAFDCWGRVSELRLWITAEDDMSWQAWKPLTPKKEPAWIFTQQTRWCCRGGSEPCWCMCCALEDRLSTTSSFPISQEDSNPWGTIQRKLLKRTCSKLYLQSHWRRSWKSINSPSRTKEEKHKQQVSETPTCTSWVTQTFYTHTLVPKGTPDKYLLHDRVKKNKHKSSDKCLHFRLGREENTDKKTQTRKQNCMSWKQKAGNRRRTHIKKLKMKVFSTVWK